MTQLTVHAGVCGFVTRIRAASDEMQSVTIECESSCPHVAKAAAGIGKVDAYGELFGKQPHETSIYRALVPNLPHVACPVCSGFLKAVEAAAGLALPRDVDMRFDAQQPS